MKNILIFAQILLSSFLVALIFLQSTGDSESRSNILSTTGFEKRGWEKIMFQLTIVILTLFIISSIIQTIT